MEALSAGRIWANRVSGWRGSDREGNGCGRSAIGCGRCMASRSTSRTATRSPSWSRPSSPSTPTTATATVAFARAAGAIPDLGGSARRAGRRARGGDPARRPRRGRRRRGSRRSWSGSASPPDLDWTETAPREESLEFLLSLPGRRPQNRRLRPDLHLGHPGDPGRRPRPPGRRPARALPGQGLVREGPRRDAGDRRPRGRPRAARQPDPARARGLPAETALRRVRAAADVPLVPREPRTLPQPRSGERQ